MNTEFRHHRAWGLSRAEFARGYRNVNPRTKRNANIIRWGAIAFGIIVIALLVVKGI